MLVSFELLETQTRFEGLRAVEGTLVLLATAVRISLHQVNQVFIVGQALGTVPASILDAAPSADLWDGQTDEDELGFTYDFVELFTGWFLKQSEDAQKAWIASSLLTLVLKLSTPHSRWHWPITARVAKRSVRV